MYFLGSFVQGFIEGQFPDLTIEQDYSFFPFPSINPEYEGAATSGADLLVMFSDNEASRSLVEYLATAEAQEIWVRRGGFTSTNKQVSLASYPDALAAKVAEQLTSAEIVRFDADDIWGGDLQAAFYRGVLDYLADQSRLNSFRNGFFGGLPDKFVWTANRLVVGSGLLVTRNSSYWTHASCVKAGMLVYRSTIRNTFHADPPA